MAQKFKYDNGPRIDSLYVRQDEENGEFFVVDGRSTNGIRHYTGSYTECLIFVGARALGHDHVFSRNCAKNAAKHGV